MKDRPGSKLYMTAKLTCETARGQAPKGGGVRGGTRLWKRLQKGRRVREKKAHLVVVAPLSQTAEI